jgi:Ca-activated chloride channel family protein
MRLAEPGWLVLLGLVVLPWWFERRRPRVAWPTLDGFPPRPGGRRAPRFRLIVPALLRGLAVACVAVALARPQTVAGRTRIAGQGVAIVVALDHSSSMNTKDFPPGPGEGQADGPVARLDAAKATLARFVAGRPDDLVGLVVFANYPDVDCPATLDHAFLLDAVRSVRPARPGDDGTNLGDALVVALESVIGTSPKKKVIVLLTDGRNSPAVPDPADPVEAAEIARGLGVTVHTIAVGKGGPVVRAVEPITKLGVTTEAEGPDLALLEAVAKAGGGRPFVATDAGALDKVFATIDALEKSPVRGEVRTRYREQYARWAAAALGLVLLDRWLAAGRYRRLP